MVTTRTLKSRDGSISVRSAKNTLVLSEHERKEYGFCGDPHMHVCMWPSDNTEVGFSILDDDDMEIVRYYRCEDRESAEELFNDLCEYASIYDGENVRIKDIYNESLFPDFTKRNGDTHRYELVETEAEFPSQDFCWITRGCTESKGTYAVIGSFEDRDDAVKAMGGYHADVSLLEKREDGRKQTFVKVSEYQIWKTVFGKDGRRKYSYTAVPAKDDPGKLLNKALKKLPAGKNEP